MSLVISAVTRAVCGLALSCSNKTPVLSSQRHFDLMAGLRWFLRRLQYEALVTGPIEHVLSTSGPWQSQNYISISFPTKACMWNILGFGDQNATTVCLPSSFQAGSSGPKFHLQSLCFSERNHLLFHIIGKVATHAAKRPFFMRNPGISEALEDMHWMQWGLCWKILYWTYLH
jgi:hypothetical protein